MRIALLTALLLMGSVTRATAESTGLIEKVETLGAPIEWHEPPELQAAGWTVYASDRANYQPFRYGKNRDGLVFLTGMMSGCPSSEIPVFELPANYRPAGDHIFMVPAAYGAAVVMGHVYILDGRVMFYAAHRPWKTQEVGCDLANYPTQSWLSLSGIVFPASESLQ